MERFLRRRLLATVVFGAILVGGCGGATVTTAPSLAGPVATSSGAPAGFSGDPCTLLTDAEVTAATGLPVVSKQAGPQMGLFNTGCDWEVGAPNQVPWSVQLGVMASGGRSYYDQYFAPFEGEKVTGIGDAALRRHADNLMAVTGDTLVAINYVILGKHDTSIVDQLLKLVIPRI